MKKLLLCFVALLGMGLIAAEALDFYQPPAKKLIECSWATPNAKYLRANIRRMEEVTPYQGLRIKLEGSGEGKGENVKTIFTGKKKWQYEWFQDSVEDLKNTEFRKFTDNFLATGVTPGDVDWFSDADWAVVCNNFAVMARIARETGMKGLIFDPEEYSSQLWSGGNIKGHSREESFAKARQRGREFGNAIFKEFPNIRLFCFFWLTMGKSYAEAPQQGNLLIPFINGVYDVLPAGAVIIEGHETLGYTATGPADYLRIRSDFLTVFPRMIDRANLAKFRHQTQLAAATYLDPYFQPRDNAWHHILKPGIDRWGNVEYFRRNLTAALEVSDEYAWTWGEYRSWWPATVDGWAAKTWESAAPGVTAAVEAAFNPVKYAEGLVAARNIPNLLRNPDFAEGEAGTVKIPGWGFWQGKNASGSYSLAAGQGRDGSNAVMVQGVANGNLTQLIPLEPGEQYLIRIRGKITVDNESPMVRIRGIADWRFPDRKTWNIPKGNTILFSETGRDGWREGKAVVTVPEESPVLFLQIRVANQAPGNQAFIDRVEVYPLKVEQKIDAADLTLGPENLLKNPSFAEGKSGSTAIPSWGFWQGKNSNGSRALEAGAGRNGTNAVMLQGVTDGCLLQRVEVLPDKQYLVRVWAKGTTSTVTVRWNDDKGVWMDAKLNKIGDFGPAGEDGWRLAEFQVKTPENAKYMSVLLGMKAANPDEKAFFDQVEVFEIK